MKDPRRRARRHRVDLRDEDAPGGIDLPGSGAEDQVREGIGPQTGGLPK